MADTSEWAERRTVAGELIERVRRPALAIEHGLEPHPEGGWYGRSWRAGSTIGEGDRERPTASLILFLLPAGEASAWHTVRSCEVWIHGGRGDVLLQLGGTGPAPVEGEIVTLSAASPHAVVAPGEWQRTLVAEHDALVSCLVSPGFSFADFALQD